MINLVNNQNAEAYVLHNDYFYLHMLLILDVPTKVIHVL